MKKLKKIERKLTPDDPDVLAYRSGQEVIAREYYVLRNDVFDFLGVFNSTPAQHTQFADLHLTHEE